MIDKLTPEQEAKIPEYLERFRNIGLSTEPGDMDIARDNIFRLYEILGNERPEHFFVFDSPMAMFKGAAKAEAKETGRDPNEVLREINVWSQSFGSFEAYWVSTYAFINNELEVEKAEGVNEVIKIVENCGNYLCYENAVFASKKPVSIRFNDQEQLHNEEGLALEYADGYGVYALDGVRVTKDIIKLVREKTNAEAVMALPNVEQRLVAMKYFGVGNMLGQLSAKELDKKDEYILYSVMIEGEENRVLSMKNPSEPKTHYEFVPPEVDTVVRAMAWRTGLEIYQEPRAKA